MSNQEIHEKIEANNDIIQYIMTPNVYTLNNTVAALIKENRELQKQCTHEFIDGYCRFCYLEEPGRD